MLRSRAETRTGDTAKRWPDDLTALSLDKVSQLVRELRVHQIELEMQNDELRRTQAELDMAQARYVDFFDLAPVGYVTVSEKGLILHANLTAAAMLGVARIELTSQVFSHFIDRQHLATYDLLRQQLLDGRTARSCELAMIHCDGGRLFVQIDGIAAPGDAGAPVLRLVLTDISAAKETAAKRRAMEQAIQNSINAAVVVIDQQGVIRMVNEPWQRLAGENNAAAGSPAASTGIGTHDLAACHRDINDPQHHASTAHDGIPQVMADALPSFTVELPCHSPTQQRGFSMCALPLGKDPKNGMAITPSDITLRRLAEEDLRIAAVAFEAQDAIVVMDSQRQILRVNRAFTDITGYSTQDVLGKTTSILRSKQQSIASYEDIWREALGEGWGRGGRWLQLKNGTDLFARITVTAVKDQAGQITHYVLTFTDQTMQQQQEQEHAQREATHREALVREVHHRINNNLQGIQGLLRLFGFQKPEIAEQMQLVAGHLNGISVIHGLQSRQGKSSVRLCELTREIAQATGVIWQTDITVNMPSSWIFRVVAEKEAVSMALVLNELLVNAIKHGGKAQGHVSVTLRQGPGREGVELSILNAGFLRNNEDRPTEHHHGLQLIESLRPREGFGMTLAQRGRQVQALLLVTAPVISLDDDN